MAVTALGVVVVMVLVERGRGGMVVMVRVERGRGGMVVMVRVDRGSGGLAVMVGFAVADVAGIPERSVVSLGGALSAHMSPTVRKRSAPTAGSHIGVFGSGGGGGP